MPIFTVGAAGTSTSAYAVDNSLRFSEDSGDYLRNPASGAAVAAERKTLTFSLWVKRAKLGSASSTQYMICGIEGTGNYYSALMFNSTDQLRFFHNESGTTRCDLKTNRVFRDPSAWYHIVLAIDTTQGTDSNRVKIYVNGVQETSFATETYYSSNFNTYFGMTNDTDGYPTYIGSNASSDHFDGYMAEVVGVGGSQLAASDFAESDSDTGIWKPKDLSDLSYGSGVAGNFLLQFQTSGTLGDDTSGNNNDFTVTNLTSGDQTTDTPTNNYCTINPLDNYYTGATISEGNLKVVSTNSNRGWNIGTIGVSQGKWYWEIKYVASGGSTPSDKWNHIGIADRGAESSTDILGESNYQYSVFESDGKVYASSSSGTTYGAAFSTGDIVQVALDLDNDNVYFGLNGQWGNGSGSWNQASPSSAVSIQAPSGTLNGDYFPAIGDGGVNVAKTWEANFGNPTFSISSSNSDGNSYGNFEYAVPSGYYALNTKNLAEFG